MSGTIHRPEDTHPHPSQNELNANTAAGLGHGLAGQASFEKKKLRTMHDVQDLHRKFHDWSDADLKQVPILPQGARLQAEGRYLNLRDRNPTERSASGEEMAGPQDFWVSKSDTPGPLWNRLLGEQPR
jgi:hypothetical protein